MIGSTPLRERFSYAFRVYSRIFPVLFVIAFLPAHLMRSDMDVDSTVYWAASENVRSGQTAYDPLPPARAHDAGSYYIYPPLLAAAGATLPSISARQHRRAFFLVLALAYWFFAAALGALWVGRSTLDSTLIAAAALPFVPGVIRAFGMTNIDPALWALCAWGIFVAGARSGALLAVASMVKPFAAYPLIARIAQDRGALRGIGAAILIGSGICFLSYSPRLFFSDCATWLRDILPTLGQGQFAAIGRPRTWSLLGHSFQLPGLISNLSPSFAPVQVAAELGWIDRSAALPWSIRIYLSAVSLAAPLLAWWLARSRSHRFQAALLLAVAILASPMVRVQYLPYLAPLAVVWFRERIAEGQ